MFETISSATMSAPTGEKISTARAITWRVASGSTSVQIWASHSGKLPRKIASDARQPPAAGEGKPRKRLWLAGSGVLILLARAIAAKPQTPLPSVRSAGTTAIFFTASEPLREAGDCEV